MSQSTAISVNITLDGQNYHEWSFCVETTLRGYGLAHMTTVCTMIAVEATRSWTIHQMDVKNAFLHGDLHEEVYMQPPPSVASPSGHVCHLWCALYGLKQAPHAWFERFASAIMAAGFIPSQHDSALFIHHSSHKLIFLLLYVDYW
jgi:hypothetical protein